MSAAAVQAAVVPQLNDFAACLWRPDLAVHTKMQRIPGRLAAAAGQAAPPVTGFIVSDHFGEMEGF